MGEYVFESVDYSNDPEWVVKEFFNSISLCGRFLDGVEKIIDRCGFVINETYFHPPDLENIEPDFHFDGLMFGVWEGEIVVPEQVALQYLKDACEKYCVLHPEDTDKIKSLLARLL
ncbi:ribonuclease toxin immunity protein CdiI [Pseudomonas sp. WHRI 8822A]|uniref:ribonuclease toxin immunity protein CdiI n=1 Tax=Pseudomonas sp. WHRI 8822A TaxID=3162568 RepID=UPI0032EDB1B9